MNRPVFEFEVRDLLSMPEAEYHMVGIVENPFYFFASRGKLDCPARHRLLPLILEMSKKKPFPYLTGNIFGGSGKSYLLLKTFDAWAADNSVVVVKVTDIVGYRYPISAVRLIGEELLGYFEAAGSATRVAILDEVEFPELYDICFQCSDHILAGGHYLQRDSGRLSRYFQEIDLDLQWTISDEYIRKHLSDMLALCGGQAAIPSNIVTLVAYKAATIGQAEAILGLLLATYARRCALGKRSCITLEDAVFWLSVFGSNWFWFSMDCWRVADSIPLTIHHSLCGHKQTSLLKIKIDARIEQGLRTV